MFRCANIRLARSSSPLSIPDSELLAARTELLRLSAELETERAISTRYLTERDEAIHELTSELATEKAKGARLLKLQEGLVGSAKQHVYLSSYLGEYTSEFLDSRTCCERAAMLGCIRATTKILWDSGVEMEWTVKTKVVRTMMAEHGFLFREPGEGRTQWTGYATMVPDVDVLEQLDRVVRACRGNLGEADWYFTELVGVLHRIVKYLEENP